MTAGTSPCGSVAATRSRKVTPGSATHRRRAPAEPDARAAYDALEQARVETDVAKRLALYRQVERIAVEDAAVIPLYFDAEYTLVRPRVHGLTLTPLGIVSFEGASVD